MRRQHPRLPTARRPCARGKFRGITGEIGSGILRFALEWHKKSSNRALRVLRANSARIPRRCRFVLIPGAGVTLAGGTAGQY